MQTKLFKDEEKTCHRPSARLCFRHHYDLMQIQLKLPCIRRIAEIRERDALLTHRISAAMNTLLRSVLRIALLTLFGACTFLLPAQEIEIQTDDNKPIEERIVYSRLTTTHLAIHTQGFGLGFKTGRIRTINRTTLWEGELISLHALNEIKTINLANYYTRPYIYGKLNSTYVLRFGYGEERRIFGKPYWGGVETIWTFEAGASLALLKPYYYYVVIYAPSSQGYEQIIEEQTFEQHSQWGEIVGKAPFTKGLGETRFSPGIHASAGLKFELGKSRTHVQAIHIKAVAEGFPLGVRIMDGQRNPWFYLTLHLSYCWGSRFNKY